MSSKPLPFAITTLLLIQTITAQRVKCIGSQLPVSLAYGPDISSGGIFTVRSTSPIAPTGVSVLSDQLVIEGPLAIDGELPFLGTVVLGGTLPSVGAGSVLHSCGGPIGISSGMSPTGPVGPSRGPVSPPGFRPGAGAPPLGVPRRGPGCGRVY